MKKPKGKLYLIPSPLGPSGGHTILPKNIKILERLEYLIAEKGKTARRFIKSVNPEINLQKITYFELNKHTLPEDIPGFLFPALEGHDVGLLSEAGCPAVADPGAAIVRLAHESDVEVVPLTGPSSLLLALMASGLNGQSFCFQGYLSPKRPQLSKDLQRLEKWAAKSGQTQIFIETPYRNNALVEEALKSLSPQTRFCIAVDLTLPTEFVKTHRVGEWQKSGVPDLHKRPAVFLIL